MNLIISIFGGMVLVVVLYAAGRGLRLSNFWAAVLAAGLPSGAYMVYASRAWPGLDVLTINLIAYPTVAVILFQLYGSNPHARVHWAPKLMVGFFSILTVLFGGFVYLATNGLPPALARVLLPATPARNLHTGFSGVVEHGEDAAKAIRQHLNLGAALEALGWQVEITGLDQLAPQQERLVVVSLRDASGNALSGAQVGIALGRPGQPHAAKQVLSEAEPGRYQAALRLAASGAWVATTHIDLAGKHIGLEHRLGGERAPGQE